jgi:glutaredoxin 3
LYVKDRCPYCEAAMDYLDQQGIAYERIEVRGDDAKLKELKELSGQTKTPTMVLNGRLLANFGVNELKSFLEEQKDPTGGGAA